MGSPEQIWSAESSRWFNRHAEEVRGYVRYEVTRRNLVSTLSEFLNQPRKVVDIGGGKGDDAIWLAGLNLRHEVVVVDPDANNIIEATKSEGFTNLAGALQGDSQVALEKYGAGHFDLVLSHGVLQYVGNPKAELEKAARLLKPGGYVSVLTAGKFGKLERYKNDRARQVRVILDGVFINNLGIEAKAYFPQEIQDMLQSVGLETTGWFGVRLFSDDDDRNVNEVPIFHLNRLLNRELTASRDPSLKPGGQMLHFIARKNT